MRSFDMNDAIVAGALAGLLSFLGTVLIFVNQRRRLSQDVELSHRDSSQKAQTKLADYRHQWLQELRDLMAAYIAHVLAYGLESNYFGRTTELQRDEFTEVIRLGTKIQLMMNPQDPSYADLNELVENITGALRHDSNKLSDFDYFAKLDVDWLALSQEILKSEWEVLKADVRALDT